jgi:hypothetical protein
MTQPANIEEYKAFRQELQTVINLKYTVLSIIIAAFGIITTIVLRTDFRDDIAPWIPLLYSFVLIPGMILNLFLTIQHRILDGFLMAAFDEAEGSRFVFQRAYDRLNVKWWWRVYSVPLAATYILLTIAAIFMSLVINSWSLPHDNPCWFILGLVLLLAGVAVHSCLIFHWATRKKLTNKIKESWKKEIKNVQDADEQKTKS